MSRHRRLQKTLRNPQRQARQERNRLGRRVRRMVRQHFADGHTHEGPGCPHIREAAGMSHLLPGQGGAATQA